MQEYMKYLKLQPTSIGRNTRLWLNKHQNKQQSHLETIAKTIKT